jgi:DNA mismatch repair ATPase MutS
MHIPSFNTRVPVDLVSSLRVNDSLKKNTSYFYAEIQRMEYIIQQLKGGKEIFVLLDEILRGTNSADKEQGSKALLKQLLHLNAAGIIATHDLNLAHLAEEFGDKIQTQCFEVEVVGDELVFDYKLRPGTSKNLSATFLMKKMGITV